MLFRNVFKSTKSETAATVINNLKEVSDRQDADEVKALCGAGNYSIAGIYKRSFMKSSEWHSLDENQRKNYVQKCRSFLTGKTNLLSKPSKWQRKPFYQEQSKHAEPDVITARP